MASRAWSILVVGFLGLVASARPAEAFLCPNQPSSSSGPPLYAHEDKCYLYYECLENQPFLLSCTYPLLYNPVEHKCGLVVDCGQLDQWNEEGDDIFVCPEPNGIFANDKYCWKYWSCGSGVAYEAECPGDYLFSVENKYCDFPDRVQCGDRQPRPDGGSSTSTPSGVKTTAGEVVSDGGLATTSGPKTTRPGGGVFSCPAQEGLFADPEDCESYYTCANFVAWLVTCPPGQQFGPDQQSCDYASNVNCKETSDGLTYITQPPSTPKPTEDPTFVCPAPTGSFAFPEDCHYYYKCEGGQATLYWCGEGMFFNEAGGYCDAGTCSKVGGSQAIRNVASEPEAIKPKYESSRSKIPAKHRKLAKRNQEFLTGNKKAVPYPMIFRK